MVVGGEAADDHLPFFIKWLALSFRLKGGISIDTQYVIKIIIFDAVTLHFLTAQKSLESINQKCILGQFYKILGQKLQANEKVFSTFAPIVSNNIFNV